MTKKRYPMTEAGKMKLVNELQQLKTVDRQETKNKIQDARKFCDFRDDWAYAEAIEEQQTIEQRIQLLEEMLANVELIQLENGKMQYVQLGSTVTLKELPDGDEEIFTIVGSAEADPIEGRISHESPLGSALLGRLEQEEVSVRTPGGQMLMKIEQIHS